MIKGTGITRGTKATKKGSVFNTTTATYAEHGINITPSPAKVGEKITINYDGLLAKSGAAQVYLHKGYGTSTNWQVVEDVPMQKGVAGFTCSFVPTDDVVNFCFHDCAQNWDNNNGQNWSVVLS